MERVKEVPPPEYKAARDPWLDELFDGNMWRLQEADWKERYTSPRSAASAIHQAARKRGFPAVVNIRGDELYVQATLATTNGKGATVPKRGTTKQAAKTTAKAPRKRAAAAA